jgi:hypothetical protein
MKTTFILAFILLLLSFHSNAQQTIDKLNVNQLKLPKESANKALILDGAGQVKSSSTITDTELGYLEGLSDTLVNLLSGKANDSDVVKLSGNQSVDGVKTFTGKLVASSTVNGSIPCPVMTEAERDLFTPVEGDCVYNSDTLKLNVFDGSVWKDVGGAGGISLWLTANPYNVNDIVIESDKIYRCLIAHTSGTFATDLAASKWGEVSQGLTSPVALADGGTGLSITAVAGSIVYVDADSFEQLSPGSAGQILQSNGSSAPSWVNKSISAKSENGSSVTAEELQVSNNQLTQVDTNKHLIESGNNNLLINPSFEHSTFSTGWTNSVGTFTEETVVEIHGKKAAKLVLSSQTMSLTQSSTLYASQFADGVQGLASVRVKSDVALKVCSIQAGVVSTSLCVDVQANNKWGLYKVPFILGATSNGISIASTGAVTGTVYIDDAFVGAVDLKADIDASKIAGESYFAGTTACSWPRTSTTMGAFTATAACPGPTVAYSSMGQWQTTDSDLPRQTINNLPAGTYKATFYFNSFTASSTNSAIAINDGATTCYPSSAEDSGISASGQTVSCTFTYSSSGNRSFELYGAAASGAINVGNSITTPAKGTKFQLEYFGSSSVYSSTNADTDWASCNFSTLAWQGLGTVTNNLKCKRQGSELLIEGSFVSGTTAASEARIPLPIWNGLQLSTSNSQIIPSIGKYGDTIRDSALLNIVKRNIILVEPSVNYLNFGQDDYSSNTNPFSKLNGSSILLNNQKMSINGRIPIEGWQNSNLIIAQLSGLESCTDTYQCTDIFSAKVNSTGIVSDENVTSFINGNCSWASGVVTCGFTAGVFTVAPNCSLTPANTTGQRMNITSITSSQFVASDRANDGTANTASDFHVICQKQGVDYIGKTAKAVASDQNVATPGVTKSTFCSAKISATGVISDQKGGCFSSCTNATTPVCTFNSNYWVSGQIPNCWLSVSSGAAGDSTVTSTTYQGISIISGAPASGARSYFCHGERQ